MASRAGRAVLKRGILRTGAGVCDHPLVMSHVKRLFLYAAFIFPLSLPAQWTPQESHTTRELRGLSVVTPKVMWASGAGGTVVHTVDGGNTWTVDIVAGAERLDLRAIAARSGKVAHAMSIGDSSRIFRTTDGGRTWSQRFIALQPGSFYDAIQFWDDRHGIAMSDPVNGRFLIAVTDDGGESWRELSGKGMPAALPGEGGFAASGTSLIVRGARDAWLVSGGASVARVYHSHDRGRTWTVSEAPLRAGVASAGVFSIAMWDGRRGAIAGGDYAKPALAGRNVALTGDGGRTWTLADSAQGPLGYRSGIGYVPGRGGRELVAVGLTGTDVSRDGGVTWMAVDSMAYNSVQFDRKGGGWAVGPKGRIARWN